jgi:two-component system C4-dicarboxylate transport response regulator DctD
VVDGESSVRVLLVSVLSRAGYQVLAFEAAEPALAELRTRPAQLAIASRTLAGMDGVSFFEAARAFRPTLQGILIAGAPTREGREAAARAGVHECVIQPFQVADILAVCEAAMKLAAAAGAPAGGQP